MAASDQLIASNVVEPLRLVIGASGTRGITVIVAPEALAQTGGLLMSKSWDVDPEGKIILFMSVDNCRFRYPVRPGDVLRTEVSVLRVRGDVVKFRGKGMVGEKLAAEAEFAAMLVDTRT